MPLDPVIQALFQQMPQLASYPMWEKTPAQARLEFKALCQIADPQGGGDREDRGHRGAGAGRPDPASRSIRPWRRAARRSRRFSISMAAGSWSAIWIAMTGSAARWPMKAAAA